MITHTDSSPWFITPRSTTLSSSIRLICFPYAGGSAATYLKWCKALRKGIELVAIQPPGRADRFAEPIQQCLEELVDDIFFHIQPLLEKPYVLLGHSLGSCVSFELLRRIAKNGLRMPLHFIASGHRAPHIDKREAPIHDLPHDDFIAKLSALDGTPEAVLQDRELMELYLPVLRADFKISETYLSAIEEKIFCPLSIFGGTEDTDIREEELLAWRDHFEGAYELCMFKGNHFFIEKNELEVIQKVNEVCLTYL